MGLRVATNATAVTTQRFLNNDLTAQRETLERLGSGSRINKAADDVIGLAMSEQFKGLIRSNAQEVRNANDGISMIQTAEGNLNEVGSILTRFRELSIQSASDTVGDGERSLINREVQQLKGEISRITANAEFNGGKKLLTGENDTIELQVGANNTASDRITLDTKAIATDLGRLQLTDFSVGTRDTARDGLGQVDNALKQLADSRAELGSVQNRLQSSVATLNINNENLLQANSRIRDTDVAQEATNMARNNIMTQAAISVLSQANQSGFIALKLIG